MIEQTHFPFLPNIRVAGQEVSAELWARIEKMAEFYKLDPSRMSAKIELLPNPENDGETHYVSATVTYHGELPGEVAV